MSLRTLINKLKQIAQFDVEKETLEILNENKEAILTLLRDQMYSGLDGDGNPTRARFGAFYADRTITEKERFGFGRGRETSVVTNYMEGNFYASIKLISNGKNFIFSSDVPYYLEIIERSGKQIMKLNKESSYELVTQIINPQLKIRREKFTNGL